MLSLGIVTTVLISALASGLLATYISSYQTRRDKILEIKRDVLRRIVGHRHFLTNQLKGSPGEPFIALNEAFVAYAEHQEVILALKKMHEDLSIPGRLNDNLLTLVKAMSKAAKVPIHNLNDDFFLRPFTPG